MGGQRHAQATLPPGKARYSLYRRLGGPHSRSGLVRKISPPPGFDSQTIPTELARSKNKDRVILKNSVILSSFSSLSFLSLSSLSLLALSSLFLLSLLSLLPLSSLSSLSSLSPLSFYSFYPLSLLSLLTLSPHSRSLSLSPLSLSPLSLSPLSLALSSLSPLSPLSPLSLPFCLLIVGLTEDGSYQTKASHATVMTSRVILQVINILWRTHIPRV